MFCGYYYDEETGFYYLQSRYYDPEICRFINADIFTTTNCFDSLGSNMFAYCENNPITQSDPSGKNVLFAIIGGISGGVSSYLAGDPMWEILLSTATGALSGFFGGNVALAINIFDAMFTTAKLWYAGTGFFEGLGWGAVSFATSYISGDDVSELAQVALENETKAYFDLTIGLTINIASECVENRIESKSNKRNTSSQSSLYSATIPKGSGNGTITIYCHANL